jgi:hypothetical protein
VGTGRARLLARWAARDGGARPGPEARGETVAVHKGITLPGMDSTFSQCRDIGPVARRYPELTFLVYHAGVEFDVGEGPYDVGRALGLDSLIRSCRKTTCGPARTSTRTSARSGRS